MVKALGR